MVKKKRGIKLDENIKLNFHIGFITKYRDFAKIHKIAYSK